MHWYNIASVAAGLAIAAISYFGARSGIKRSLDDARSARTQEWNVEHARWMRDKRSEVYEATIEEITTRSQVRLTFFAIPEGAVNHKSTLDHPPAALRSRLRLYGSAEASRLADLTDDAHHVAVIEYLKWIIEVQSDDEAKGPIEVRSGFNKAVGLEISGLITQEPPDEAVMKAQEFKRAAIMAADVTDRNLLDFLTSEIARPVHLG